MKDGSLFSGEIGGGGGGESEAFKHSYFILKYIALLAHYFHLSRLSHLLSIFDDLAECCYILETREIDDSDVICFVTDKKREHLSSELLF